jgi:hypothetical protein
MFEMWMDIGGHQQEEFKMYLENPMRSAAIHPTQDVDFIKPPMVDREGVIMCPNANYMHGSPSRIQGYRTQGRYLTQAEPGTLTNATLLVTGVKINRYTGGNTVPTAASIVNAGNYIHTWVPEDNNWTGSAAFANI